MSATDSLVYIIELGETNLIIARANLGQRPRVVEEVREIWLGDAAALETNLGELKAAGTTGKAITLLRPKGHASFLADATQAQKVKSASAVEEFLREALGAENTPANWAWVSARDGRPPENGITWAVDAIPTATTDEALGKIKEWAFEPLRCEPGALSLAGALTGLARANASIAPVLLCDVSETRSFLFVITGQGISNLVTIPAGFDALAEATQGALGLKFRGSAARLLFNDSYDFAEAAAKIIEPLAAGIRGALPSLGAAPTSLVCSGILARQSWITQALAAATTLKPFATDVGAWAASNGLSLGSNVKADTIGASWLGALSALAAYEQKNPGAVSPWHPLLSNTPVAAAPFVPAIAPEPPPPPKPAVVVTPPPKPPEPAPAPKPATPPAAKPAEPAPKAAVVITPPAKPAEPAKPAAAPTPSAAAKPGQTPAPAAKPGDPKAKQPEAKSAAPAPAAAKPGPAPAAAAKPPAKPEPAKPAPAPVAAKPGPAPAPAASSARAATPAPFPKKKNSAPMLIAIIAVLLLGGGGFFFYQKSSQAEKDRIAQQAAIDAEKKRAAEEAARARSAEERLRAEAEARKKAEEDARLKEIADREARIRAEEEARRSTTERLLNARGSLVINTDPAGATVAVGELAPRQSPVTLKDLRLGHYSVTISLAGYDTETRDVEIKEGQATDLGTIKLRRQVGGIEISSDPAGLGYEIKPAGVLFVNSNDIRTGQTPATLNDLPVGNYQVSISRPNWPNYVQNVSVERGGSVKVQSAFVGGGVTITSTPSGAAVMREQTQIGTTPLTLNDLIPGPVSYTLTLRGMDTATVTGKVEPGKTLALNATLLESDRIMKQSELDERPVQVTVVQPEVTAAQEADGGTVLISFVIGKDGIPTEIKIDQTPNQALGRACLAAVAKWRFTPGKIKGRPVRTRMQIPIKFSGANP
jgi:TonB family protein